MRILFASTQGAGHFRPLLPFIDASTRHGHETLVVGPPTLNARGHPFRAGASPPEEVLGPIWGAMSSLPPGQGDVVVVGVIFARLNVEAMLPTLESAMEDFRPDLVLREAAEFASAIAAERHRCPTRSCRRWLRSRRGDSAWRSLLRRWTNVSPGSLERIARVSVSVVLSGERSIPRRSR